MGQELVFLGWGGSRKGIVYASMSYLLEVADYTR